MNFALAVGLFAFLRWLYTTRFGLAINAIRDDEEKAEGMGLHTTTYKRLCWGVSAFFLGISGACDQGGYLDLHAGHPMGRFGPLDHRDRGLLPARHCRLDDGKAPAVVRHQDRRPGPGGGGVSDSVIEIAGVSKSFGGVAANRDISLTVERGKITGLIGPNGSGKTTLFNSIVGYHPIDTGSIRFEGQEISKLTVQQIARRGLLRTFQQTRIYGRMNCIDNMLISVPHRKMGLLDMFACHSRRELEKAEQLLAFVGLYEKRFLRAGSLSFGQQKLLEFAMALMNEPAALLLDEPTAGINPTLINGLIDRLKRANSEFGITLVIVEHNMRVIMNMADKIYCLAHGQLLAAGTPKAIRSDQRVIDAYLGAH